jgi:hypothetical protein
MIPWLPQGISRPANILLKNLRRRFPRLPRSDRWRRPLLESLESRLLLFGCDDPGPSQPPDTVDDVAAAPAESPIEIAVLANDTHADGLPFAM